jgi:hypothetical protein
LLDPQRVEQPGEVGNKVLDVVSLGVVGGVRTAVAALAGNDHPEAGLGERVDLVAPRVRVLGEAVQEQYRRALALLEVLHRDPVGFGGLGGGEIQRRLLLGGLRSSRGRVRPGGDA